MSVFTRSQQRRKRLGGQQSKGVNAFTGGRACTTRSRARIHPHIACTLHARRHPRRHAHRHIRAHTHTHTHTYARMLTHRFAQIKRTHVKKHPRAPHAHTHTRAHMCARTHTAQAKFQETSSLLAKGALVLRKLDLEKPLRTRLGAQFLIALSLLFLLGFNLFEDFAGALLAGCLLGRNHLSFKTVTGGDGFLIARSGADVIPSVSLNDIQLESIDA